MNAKKIRTLAEYERLRFSRAPMDEWTVYRLTEPEIRKLAEG
jgi:hypothetical protein